MLKGLRPLLGTRPLILQMGILSVGGGTGSQRQARALAPPLCELEREAQSQAQDPGAPTCSPVCFLLRALVCKGLGVQGGACGRVRTVLPAAGVRPAETMPQTPWRLLGCPPRGAPSTALPHTIHCTPHTIHCTSPRVFL